MDRLPFTSTSTHDIELELLDLTCPSCDADLIGDELFLSHRMCGTCGRHFSIGARERITLLVDAGQFSELAGPIAGQESSPARDQFPSAERLAEHQHMQVIGDAVVTGTGRIGGVSTVVIALDDHLVGPALGALMTDKIIIALDHARSRRQPVVLLCAGGTVTAQAGPLSLVQGGRLASAFARLHMEGMPVAGVLAHPVSGALFGILVAHCDVLYSEPGVHVGSATSGNNIPDASQWWTVDVLHADGWIDGIVARSRLRRQVGTFLDLACNPGVARAGTAAALTEGNQTTAGDSLANLERVGRPHADEMVSALLPEFIELKGDRVEGEDHSVVCGLGRLESLTIAVAAQRRIPDKAAPEVSARAARKIARLGRLAGRLEIPLVLLVDGDPPDGGEPFSPTAAFAVASLASMLSVLPVPIIAIGLGRVAGTLAPTLMAGDRQFLLDSAVYASSATRPSGMGGSAAHPRPSRSPGSLLIERGVLTARECARFGLVDGVIAEPARGAHLEPVETIAAVRDMLLVSLAELTGTGQRRLLDTRQRRQRTLGQSTPEGLAAARSELWELHELQRSVGRSIDDWRERWEQLKASQPRLSFQRPDMADLATRLRARRAELLERARPGDRTAE